MGGTSGMGGMEKSEIPWASIEVLRSAVERGVLSWERIYELGELLNSKAPVRTDPKQITLFNNNIGMGIQFAALGSRVLAQARERGVGIEIPSEWFVEDTPP